MNCYDIVHYFIKIKCKNSKNVLFRNLADTWYMCNWKWILHIDYPMVRIKFKTLRGCVRKTQIFAAQFFFSFSQFFFSWFAWNQCSIGDVNVLIDGEAVDARDEALDGFDDDDKTCNRNFLAGFFVKTCNWAMMSLFFRRRFFGFFSDTEWFALHFFLHDLGTLQDVLERHPGCLDNPKAWIGFGFTKEFPFDYKNFSAVSC